jgi:peptidoglycan/xylan/chitin deacetylase (PgdA/CDA1 family)
MQDHGMRKSPRAGVPDMTAASAESRSWLRPFIGMLSPSGAQGRLTILIFHRVHEQRDLLFPTAMHASAFRERMQWVRSWFNVMPLDDAVAALANGSIPARALAITFDDGYANNYTVALPILRQLGLHATFFITSGFLDGGQMWNDTLIEAIRRSEYSELDFSALGLGRYKLDSLDARRLAIMTILTQLRYLSPSVRQQQADAIEKLAGRSLPRDLMMTRTQVRGLASIGMGIGGHTVSHPILARVDDETARREIADGRDALEEIVRQSVKLFAYPNGKPGADYTAAHVAMVRKLGLSAAVSTAPGAARVGDSLHELPRFTPWDATRARWGWKLTKNLTRSVRVA